jgi:hypothetical protein
MYRQVTGMSVLNNRGDLINGIQRAELGALGDRDDLGLGSVLIALTSRLQLDQRGSQLALGVEVASSLSPDPLGRTALVDVDVRGLGADDRWQILDRPDRAGVADRSRFVRSTGWRI